MAEIANELMYEILKAMQQRPTNIEDRVSDVNGQLVAMRGHLRVIKSDVNNIYVSVEQLDGRMSHIERRLDIVDNRIA